MDQIVQELKKQVVIGNGKTKEETDEKEEEIIKRFLCRNGEDEPMGFPPAFFSRLPNQDEFMKLKIRDESREMLLMRKSQDLFDHDELTDLYGTLEKHASPPFGLSGDEKFINFLDFKRLLSSSSVSVKCKKLLSAKTFAKLLMDDPYGRVSVTTLFNYVMRKTWLKQTRIGLSIYDDTGRGYIKESGLESYINELIPTLVQLKGLDSTFLPFYVCTAVRKFFFFLDPNRTGRIKILDILSCGFIDDLLDLREDEPPRDSNWFSFQSTMRVYGNYLNLDQDHNGMLSKKEIMNWNNGSLTETFVNRMFQEYLTFSGEIDYRTYLDFVLAMENRREPQSVQYFFRILDINQKGYLDSFCLHYFFKDILKFLRKQGMDNILFDDVKDEIYDMVKPKDPFKITLQDLIRSRCGDVVVSILTDFNGFWMYENREMQMPDPNLMSQQQQQQQQQQTRKDQKAAEV
jgi:Ca2+-binding EF-hand superfamily protein